MNTTTALHSIRLPRRIAIILLPFEAFAREEEEDKHEDLKNKRPVEKKRMQQQLQGTKKLKWKWIWW